MADNKMAIPDFELGNQDGEVVNFYKALDATENGLIIFVYPKANTPGCTKQACGFRDAYDNIQKYGFDVLGMSRDKAASQLSWKTKQNLPFDLLCEGDAVLSEMGCLNGASLLRSVFVVDKASRKLILSHVKIGPEASVSAVLDLITNGEDNQESKEEEEEPIVAKPGKPPRGGVKKTSDSVEKRPRRGATKRTAPDEDESPIEKKKVKPEAPSKSESSTKSEKTRSMRAPSGKKTEEDSTSMGKGGRRPRKDSETEPASTSAPVRKGRAASQPAAKRASSRTTRKTDEETKKTKEVEAKEPKPTKKAASAKAESGSKKK